MRQAAVFALFWSLFSYALNPQLHIQVNYLPVQRIDAFHCCNDCTPSIFSDRYLRRDRVSINVKRGTIVDRETTTIFPRCSQHRRRWSNVDNIKDTIKVGLTGASGHHALRTTCGRANCTSATAKTQIGGRYWRIPNVDKTAAPVCVSSFQLPL